MQQVIIKTDLTIPEIIQRLGVNISQISVYEPNQGNRKKFQDKIKDVYQQIQAELQIQGIRKSYIYEKYGINHQAWLVFKKNNKDLF